MKALLFLLMIGSAMGQTGPIDNSTRHELEAFCGTTITLGKSSKAIKDIFPEECGKLKPVAMPITYWPAVPTEAPDAPAVKEWKNDECQPCRKRDVVACIPPCRSEKWTCADTSRILLTAEDGKKWCHKPVTK